MIRPDHVKHFFVCFMLSALLLTAAQWRPVLSIVAALAVLAVGIIKEVKDIGTTGFDWTDILADVVGIVVALSLWGISSITAR